VCGPLKTPEYRARGPLELFRDWTSPLANKAREVIAWYFAEIPKLTAEVCV